MYFIEGDENDLLYIVEEVILFFWWEIKFYIASTLVNEQFQNGFTADIINHFVDIDQNIQICTSYYKMHYSQCNI
jgi:hypothetical protein